MARDRASLAPRAEMEQAPSQRVKGSTKPKPRARSASIARPSQPTSTSRRRKKIREPTPQPEGDFYSVKDIIAEKTRESDGQLLYLIDWEDDPETGKSWDPTWEPADFVTEKAIVDWEQKKATQGRKRKREANETGSSALEVARESSSPFASAQDSQPAIAARRKASVLSNTSRAQEREVKKRRRGSAASRPRSQSASQGIPDIPHREAAAGEIKDSYEEDLQSSAGNVYAPVVEIGPFSQTFNPGEYITVASQTSQAEPSTGPLSHSSPLPSTVTPPAQLRRRPKTPAPRREIFWEEDFESVVLDSQEPDSLLYGPPETQTLGSESDIRSATQNLTQIDPSTDSPGSADHTSSGSGGIASTGSSGLAGSSSYHPSTNVIEGSEQIPNSEAPITAPPSTEQTFEPTRPVSQESQVRSVSPSAKEAPEDLQAIESSRAEQLSLLEHSNHSLVGVRENASGNTTRTSHQEDEIPDAQPDCYEISSSIPFQTQVSLLPSEDEHTGTGSDPLVERLAEPRPVTPLTNTGQEPPSSATQLGDNQATPVSILSHSEHRPQTQDWPRLSIHSDGESEFYSPQATFEQQSPPTLGRVIQSVEQALGATSPPRTPGPLLPSDSTMADQPPSAPPTTDTKQLMREARERAVAKRAAERAATRSASTMPASPPPHIAGQMLPLRETIIDTPAPILPVELVSSPKPSPEADEEPVTKVLRILPLNPDEYAIPLPMVSYARDIYLQVIRNYKKQRLAFFEEEGNATVAAEIDLMLVELEKLCDHQDLIADDFSSQRAEPIVNQARYAETVSTKCIFLGEFITALRSYAKHVVIVSRPGRLQEILEALLIRHGFNKTQERPNGFFDASGGPMEITLIPAHNTSETVCDKPTDVVIAFTEPTATQRLLLKTCKVSADTKKAAPWISLVVTNSVEHLDRCLKKNIDDTEKRLFMVNCLSQIQGEVGKLSPDFPSPPDTAQATASFLINETEGAWIVPEMPEIEGIEFEIPPSQTASRDGQISGSTTQSYDLSSSTQQPFGAKRQLVLDDTTGSDSPKRQRLSPLPDEEVHKPATSRGNETPFPVCSDLMHSAVEPWKMAPNMNTIDGEQQGQLASLLSRINDLENKIRIKDASESELKEQTRNLEAACQDLELGIKAIQPKYQDALNDRGHFEHEITECLRRESTLRRKHDDRVAELAKVREEKEAVDSELALARSWLASSSIPEIAEMTKMKDEVRTIKEENDRLQRRHATMQNDLEFMRNQYQTASYEAAESSRNVKALEETVAKLTIKASENAVRIHEIHNSSEIKQHLDRVKELSADNEELDRELERKTEDLRALTNGRRQTRGASVPRSPRMGTNTMSPNARPSMGRVMGNFGGANGSRGNSPAPGEMGARPYQFFGDALFQGPNNSSARWGNHLQ